MSATSVALSKAEENIVNILTKEEPQVGYHKWSEYLRKLGFRDFEIDKHRDNRDFSGLARYWCKHVGPNTDSKIFESIRKEVLGQEVSPEKSFDSINFTKLRKRRNRALFVYEFIRSYDIANWKDLVRGKLDQGDKLPVVEYNYKNDIEEQKYRVFVCWLEENNFTTIHSAVEELKRKEIPIIPECSKEISVESWCDSEQESEFTGENLAEFSFNRRYRLHTLFSKGKTANLYVARSLNGDDVVCAKILIPQHYNISQVDSIAKFKHSNIVRFYNILSVQSDDKKEIAFVMELCYITVHNYILKPSEWVDVKKEQVGKGNVFGVLKIGFLEILRQSTSALVYLHSTEAVHGAIKPSNFLLTLDETGKAVVKLSDIGVTPKLPNRAGSLHITKLLSSEAYLPPEAISCTNVADIKLTSSYDIFSFGIMWYFVLTNGQGHPFGGMNGHRYNVSEQNKPTLELKDLKVDLNPTQQNAVLAIIKKMLSFEPSDRCTAAEIDGYKDIWAD